MKVGILTFSNAYNLGGALQAYSLQKALEESEVDAELIDYRCSAIENMHKLRPVFQSGIGIKTRLYNAIHNLVFSKRRKYYKEFQKTMRRSKQYTKETISQANGVYDVFISGSDQVFNLKLTDNDSTYFLDFVKKGIKTSYAASIGVYVSEHKEYYLNYLQLFDYLSVREKSSAEIIENELGLMAEVMPDPVFLHTSEEWKELLSIETKVPKEKYVLVYSLAEAKELYQIANQIAFDKGLKVYVITKVLKPLGKADKYFRSVGPREFIELISCAEHVVTNSFHGTAFSLIFQKQFTILSPKNAPERIIDLLTDFHLSHCVVKDCNSMTENEIRYDDIIDSIRSYRNIGREYLKKICSEND